METPKKIRAARIKKELDTLRAKPTEFKDRVAGLVRERGNTKMNSGKDRRESAANARRVMRASKSKSDKEQRPDAVGRMVSDVKRFQRVEESADLSNLASEEHKRGRRGLAARMGITGNTKARMKKTAGRAMMATPGYGTVKAAKKVANYASEKLAPKYDPNK